MRWLQTLGDFFSGVFYVVGSIIAFLVLAPLAIFLCLGPYAALCFIVYLVVTGG